MLTTTLHAISDTSKSKTYLHTTNLYFIIDGSAETNLIKNLPSRLVFKTLLRQYSVHEYKIHENIL